MRILTINSGSSSLKFSLYDVQEPRVERLVLAGALERIGAPNGVLRVAHAGDGKVIEQPQAFADHRAALEVLEAWLAQRGDHLAPEAVGHRVVHGGPAHRAPERLTPALLAALTEVLPLARDHLPHELDAIRAMMHAYPALPQVVCFDTAFHRHMPRVAQRYALPQRFWDAGVRRYGFHGLSYEYIVGELGRSGALGRRTIIAHLGGGASMAAVRDGVGVETTMGFTPTSGLVMSVRSGDLDPNVVLYLLRAEGLDVAAAGELVNRRSGLLALSGASADMKDLLALERTHSGAAEAIAVYCHRARQAVGALVATLGGLDTLVFTGGVGEHAASVRRRICEGLECFGVVLDAQRNEAGAPVISSEGAPAVVRVLPTNEELMIARHTFGVLGTC
jgi:acetate kinase